MNSQKTFILNVPPVLVNLTSMLVDRVKRIYFSREKPACIITTNMFLGTLPDYKMIPERIQNSIKNKMF